MEEGWCREVDCWMCRKGKRGEEQMDTRDSGEKRGRMDLFVVRNIYATVPLRANMSGKSFFKSGRICDMLIPILLSSLSAPYLPLFCLRKGTTQDEGGV